MPKIPTFTSRARLTGEAASVTSNIQIDPRQNIASALRPIGKAVEDYYVKEKAIETKVKAGELNADATVEIFNAAEQAELKSTPQDGVDYFNNKFKTIKEKYKAQASNKNVANTFDILLSQNKNVYVNNILKKTRTNLVTTRVDQVDQRVKSRIAAAVASESQFEFDILAKSIEEDYQGLVNDGIIGKKDLEIYRQKLPALIETQMVKNKAINNAFGALVLLDDNKKYPNIKGDEREKLRTELRQIATFQGKVVDFATNKILLESKKKVAAALAGDEADKFFGINPDEIDQYYTGNEEYDNQINNLNNKIINNEISLDNNYLTNDKIINKILNNEIKNSYEKFKLTGETEAKSITERIGDGSVNLDDDNFFNNIFESQQNPELNKTNKEFFGFIDKVVPLIEGSTSSKYFDNNYNNRLSSFRQDMYGRFVEGLKQNIPVAKLLDSLSDNYIAKDILDYAPTKANVRDALSSFAQEQEPELVNTYFKKNENETPNEYITRTTEFYIKEDGTIGRRTKKKIKPEDIMKGSVLNQETNEETENKFSFISQASAAEVNIENNNIKSIHNYLTKRISPEASAAILGNMFAEGETFNFTEEEITTKEIKGYGLFQFTDEAKGKGHRTEYNKYLKNTNKEDSVESQIDYVLDNIYEGIGYDIGGSAGGNEKLPTGNRKKLQEIFQSKNVEEITEAFHNIFERPQSGSLEKRKNEAIKIYKLLTDNFPNN